MPVYKEVNKSFFKRWTPDMAYTLGFFAADGNMIRTNRGTHFFSFNSADKSILFLIRQAMSSNHKISKRISETSTVYRLQIGSREMFDDLSLLEFVPKKSKRLKVPKVPNELVGDFIRGYFDGDGNVWIGFINKNRKKPTHVLQVAFTSSCAHFLKELWQVLRKEGVRGGSLYKLKDKECARLSFSTLDALKLYEIMYNMPHKLFLKRKKLVFEKFIKMRS